MTEAQLKDVMFKVLKRIAPEADTDSLKPDQDVRRTLDIDSYDFMMFLVGLNEELGVEIPESDYGKLVSTEDIIRYLSARVTT